MWLTLSSYSSKTGWAGSPAPAFQARYVLEPNTSRSAFSKDLGGSGEDSDAAEDAPVVPEAEPLLTDREEQILPLIAEGLTSPQIADKVFLSLATIKWYRKKLMIKLDAANTAELISKAKEKGLI